MTEGMRQAMVTCPGCGKKFPINTLVSGLGRKPYDIPLQNVCKALRAYSGNYSGAAEQLAKDFGIKVTPGFVHNRVHRAGLTLTEVMNGKGG